MRSGSGLGVGSCRWRCYRGVAGRSAADLVRVRARVRVRVRVRGWVRVRVRVRVRAKV